MPINKALWTPSYVLLTAGFACLVFGVCYWLLDAQPSAAARAAYTRWAAPLLAYGMNALFLFVLSGLLAKLLYTLKLGEQSLLAWIVGGVKALGLSPVNSSLLYAIGFVLLFQGIAMFMKRKQWFIKV